LKIKEIFKDDLNFYIKNIYDNKNSSFCYQYNSKNLNDTIYFATYFAKYMNVGDIININGELGAGKTVFMSGIAKYFNIESEISSPTFTIVNEYNILKDKKIFHFDVYRIEDSSEFLDCIGTDYFQNGICIIEWGDIIKDILPANTVNIQITKDDYDENIRIFKIWRENI
jgi:tRNA threonylcarbamoyladenosine biosynthesis protein TsaE